VPIVLKSGNLNLLEPSGPVQVCNGIDLPLPLHLHLQYIRKSTNYMIYLRLNSSSLTDHIIKLHPLQFFPAPCYFLFLMTTYNFRHPMLRHLRPVFSLYNDRKKFLLQTKQQTTYQPFFSILTLRDKRRKYEIFQPQS